MYDRQPFPVEASAIAADEVGSHFWQDVCHHKGASDLLKTRLQLGYTPNLALDRAVRSQCPPIIILRGVTVPEWITDGSGWGEESPVLELDGYMVRIANLRAKCLQVLSQRKEERSLDPHQLKTVAGEADELNIALESWAQNIPESWHYSVHNSPPTPQSTDAPGNEPIYKGTYHVYISHALAAVWNRYRAIRLIVNSIFSRLLSELLLVASLLPHCDTCAGDRIQLVQTQQRKSRDNIESLAIDMCCSLPCFFNPNARLQATPGDAISPKLACLMVWPVAVGICTRGVPELQRVRLRARLLIAAKALGDTALEMVDRNDVFKF